MGNSNVPVTAGAGTTIDTYQVTGGDHRQIVIPSNHGGYSARFGSFVIPGRAATSHNLAAIHKATGSSVLVDVAFIGVDAYQTVIKAVTVPPPVIRVSRFTAIPTGGTTGTKAPEDTALSTNASVTLWQDASADRTSSGTALTITPGATITQEFAPRMITAAGYEMADRMEFLTNAPVTLRALEGLVVSLVSPAGTSEPVTDMFCVTIRWEEYAA
jgi:hypothetical protein